jgi:hypothetical protein
MQRYQVKGSAEAPAAARPAAAATERRKAGRPWTGAQRAEAAPAATRPAPPAREGTDDSVWKEF